MSHTLKYVEMKYMFYPLMKISLVKLKGISSQQPKILFAPLINAEWKKTTSKKGHLDGSVNRPCKSYLGVMGPSSTLGTELTWKTNKKDLIPTNTKYKLIILAWVHVLDLFCSINVKEKQF